MMMVEAGRGLSIYYESLLNLLQVCAIVPLFIGAWITCTPSIHLGRILPWTVRIMLLYFCAKVIYDAAESNMQPVEVKIRNGTAPLPTLFTVEQLLFTLMLIAMSVGWFGLLFNQSRVARVIGARRVELSLILSATIWTTTLVAASANYLHVRATLEPLFNRLSVVFLGGVLVGAVLVFGSTLALLFALRAARNSINSQRPC
jgi:hypothetical protein